MRAAHVSDDVQGKVATNAIKCVTMLDGLLIVELAGKISTWDEHIYGANAKWPKNLRTWSKAGVVKEYKENKSVN